MAAQVKLPGVGPVSRRALLLGGGAAVLVMGVLWWRKRHTTAPAAGVDPAAVDLTGSDGSGMAGGGGPLVGPTPSTVPPSAATNPQWTQLVMAQLAGTADPTALATALGLYLTGAAVTGDQELLIDQAIAVEGYPPVAGPTNYPPAIRTQPGGGQTPGSFKDNAGWELAAMNWYFHVQTAPKWGPPDGPAKIYNAIHSWLEGVPIWRDEWTEIGKIIAAVGPPPAPPAGVKFLA